MTTEPPRRRILTLKSGIAPKTAEELFGKKRTPAAKAPPPPPPAPSFGWKCKPCGKGFDPPAEGPDDEVVRCPNCNARVGVAGDFRADPPPARLRARPVKKPA